MRCHLTSPYSKMSSLVGLKNLDWDLSNGKLNIVDSWWLMGSPIPILIILATYLAFVLRVGPQYMHKREPFKLTALLVFYNAAQVLFSLYLAYMYLNHILKYGLLHSKCLMYEEQPRSEILNGIWWYMIAKVSELLDTIFFVLRKKNSQITFLHLYHHSIMMIGTWAYLKYTPTDNAVFIGLFNSSVHIMMYTYYGLAACGPRVAKYLTWKKYMTKVQLVQFVSMLVHYVASLAVSECPPSKGVYCFFAFNIMFFFFLFANFYRKSYKEKHNFCFSVEKQS